MTEPHTTEQPDHLARRTRPVPTPRCSVGRPHCQEPALPALQVCADCRAAGYCPWCGVLGTNVGYCSTDCLVSDGEPRRLEAEWVANLVKAYFHAPAATIQLDLAPDNPDAPVWALTWDQGPWHWASRFTAAVNDLSPELPAADWPGHLYVDAMSPSTLAVFFV